MANGGQAVYANVDAQSLVATDMPVPVTTDGVKAMHDGQINITTNTLTLPSFVFCDIGPGTLAWLPIAPGFMGVLAAPPVPIIPPAGTQLLQWRVVPDGAEPPANLIRLTGSVMYG